MLKLTCISVVFLGATYLGYYFGESYRNRYRQLSEIHRILLFLNNEVLYGSTPIPIAFQNMAYRIKEPFNKIFEKAGNMLVTGEVDSVSEALESSFKEEKDRVFLTKEDMLIVQEFSKNLGGTGVYGQEKVFDLAIENIKKSCNDAEKQSKENIKMCRALGFTIGAMTAIILI